MPRFQTGGLPPLGHKRISWWTRKIQLVVSEKKATFKRWLGIKGPSKSNAERRIEQGYAERVTLLRASGNEYWFFEKMK
ncbi:unnamed protein product [Soboliphyme baturini]|uniref:AP2/ERF domain-containing protein n=1 Tax=Soboliphyme baturini TaxID=241478 RepID=A0A183IKF7_9BILA|nr:unnamed protein product [Soboliphyme baturini]